MCEKTVDHSVCASRNLSDENVNLDVHETHAVHSVKPYHVDLCIESRSVKMEVDMSAARTTVSEAVHG